MIMTVTNANRQKRYRERCKASGKRAPSGKSGKSGKGGKFDASKWARAQFIALDGEGENVGKAEKYVIQKRSYHAKEHRYTLLAASTGESLYNKGQRLVSKDCCDFLCDIGSKYPKGIFVIFAGGYDINHMLMWGFSRDDLRKIGRGERLEWQYPGTDTWYSIEYRARKSLTLRRGLTFRQDAKGNWIKKWESSLTVWDVFGFFQENFVGVMRKWLGEKWQHFELIKTMKKLRGNFSDIEQRRINAYNAAELETLTAIMEKLHDAIDGLGLKVRRWDGAGSVAAAMMREHKIKDFKSRGEMGPQLQDAVRTAYAGGRIEVCKIGTHEGAVYDYDINSAYPYVMANLPCLACGSWIRGSGNPLPGFTLVHCKFDFIRNADFYPLFYRTEQRQISYPRSGEGWYWLPEYEAALSCPGIVDVLEWWHFEPACNHKPFHWIKRYYAKRQRLLKENPFSGEEKIIKLGLNSLYGKSAQQLGGRDGNPPAYHQMEWAGYITSTTRARLYMAAQECPEKIIGFATDGIFTHAPLERLVLSTSKEFGAWSLKTPVPSGMTVAMAGVYWWHHANEKYEHFSRGFDKDSLQTPFLIQEAWRKGMPSIDVPMQRLVGIGSACASDTLWKMRGRFTTGFRSLKINGDSHKRGAIDVVKRKLHLRLCDLKPNENFDYIQGVQICSHPYPLEWLAEELDADYANELELIKEMGDTENV